MEKEKIDEALDKIYKLAESLDKRIQALEEKIKPGRAITPKLVPALRSVFFTFSKDRLYLVITLATIFLVGIGYFSLFAVTGLKPVFNIPGSTYNLLLAAGFAVLIGLPLSLMLYEFRHKNVIRGTMASATGGALAGGAATVTSFGGTIGGTTLGTTGSSLVGSCASMFGASAVSVTGSTSSVAASGVSAALGTIVGPALMAVALVISYISFNKSIKDFYRRHR